MVHQYLLGFLPDLSQIHNPSALLKIFFYLVAYSGPRKLSDNQLINRLAHKRHERGLAKRSCSNQSFELIHLSSFQPNFLSGGCNSGRSTHLQLSGGGS